MSRLRITPERCGDDSLEARAARSCSATFDLDNLIVADENEEVAIAVEPARLEPLCCVPPFNARGVPSNLAPM